MPIQYAGIMPEHDAVRRRAGMFDLSHMGQFVLTGDGVPEFLDALTCNAVGTMKPGQARYNIFTNEHGGALDDTIVYRMPQRWLVVVNAANSAKMSAWLQPRVPAGVRFDDRTARSALIAVQGPRALELLQPLVDVDLTSIGYYHAAEGRVAGIAAEIARTGYTGEDGFELFIAASDARLWQRLLDEADRVEMQPCGLGARDVLRLEAGMPLYGHELAEDITPLMAGLTWAVKLDKGEFVGRDALRAQRDAGGYHRLVGFEMDGKAPARAEYAVYHQGAHVGDVRSGSPSPSLHGKNIGTALVAPQAASAGTRLEIEIRGSRHGARVVPMPFYKRKAMA